MIDLSLLQRCIFNKITSEPDILRRGATTTTTTTCVWTVHRKSAYVYVCAWVRVCSSNYILLLITMRRAYSTYMCSTIRLIFFFLNFNSYVVFIGHVGPSLNYTSVFLDTMAICLGMSQLRSFEKKRPKLRS